MNKNILKKHINKIIKDLPSNFKKGKSNDLFKTIIYCHQNVNLNNLIAEMRNVPQLHIFNDKMMHVTNTGRRIDFSQLATWLIYRSIEVGVEDTLLNLERYISESDFVCLEIKILGGFEVSQTFSLTSFIDLIPLEDNIIKKFFPHEELMQQKPIFKPKVALVRKFMHPKVHLESGERWKEAENYVNFSQELEDARLCLTPIVLNGPVSFGTFIITDDYVPCAGGMGGHGGFPPFVELKVHKKIEMNSDDFNRFKCLFETFIKLEQNKKKQLLVSLQRLNSATCRYSIIDAAIDLGISMEALFLSGHGEDQGELSFRLRLRAAKLLGTDENNRSYLFNIFNRFYKLRSDAVHKGVLSQQYGGKSVMNLLEEGFLYMGRAIEILVSRKGHVNWDEIILN